MGLNFYLWLNICPHCRRHDQEHIGKSSVGWTFSFHGERSENGSLAVPITSYKDWLSRIESSGGEIYDEYDRPIPLAEFKAMVEAKRSEKQNHSLYARELHPEYAKECWLDPEGHSFSEGEFS